MKFRFIEAPHIPRLAWCAHVKPERGITNIIHGPGVETHDDWFFEGAWDGPFDGPGFVEATTCMGTGARIQNDTVKFVSTCTPYRGLVTFKTPKHLILSNSLPFLLAQIGDKPDIDYLRYYSDLYKNSKRGFVRKPRPLLMRNESRILIHLCCNISIENNKIDKTIKSYPEPPTCFEDYKDQLVKMLIRVRENATDPRRDKKIYLPMTTLSRGYDSVACSALGAAAGWKDAVTLVPFDSTDADNDDDGSPIAEHLGLSIEKFDTEAWRQRTDIPEAEFVATAWRSVMVRFAGMENKLQDTLLIVGAVGDFVWDPNSKGILKNFGRPIHSSGIAMGHESHWEFQLRVGIITAFPAGYAATHWDKLRLMMIDKEMQPWSIGGDYDRPFPRRIAEEMGVPRQLFGQRKIASSHTYPGTDPSVNGHADYIRFLNESGITIQDKNIIDINKHVPRLFHWGIDHTMRRYVVDVSKG